MPELDPEVVRLRAQPDLDAGQRERAMRGLFYAYGDPREQLWAFHEIRDLRQWVVAFGAIWAVQHAKEWGLPKGALFGAHYDILKRCGARMDDFTRYERPMAEGGVGCVGHAPEGEG